MVLKMWKGKLSGEDFGFEYDNPEHFVRSHWQKANRVLPVWVAYRAVMAAYFVLSLHYTVIPIDRDIPEENSIKYLIFLTHWTYLLEVTVFVWGLVIVSIRYSQENRKSKTAEPFEKMPVSYKIYWALYTIALSSTMAVSVIFWVGVYDPAYFPVDASNLIEHLLNTVLMMFDFALVGHPVRLFHVYLTLAYGSAYALFSVIYYLCGGTGVKGLVPIYNILDWRNPGKACITCAACFAFLGVLHVIFHVMSRWKTAFKKEEPPQ